MGSDSIFSYSKEIEKVPLTHLMTFFERSIDFYFWSSQDTVICGRGDVSLEDGSIYRMGDRSIISRLKDQTVLLGAKVPLVFYGGSSFYEDEEYTSDFSLWDDFDKKLIRIPKICYLNQNGSVFMVVNTRERKDENYYLNCISEVLDAFEEKHRTQALFTKITLGEKDGWKRQVEKALAKVNDDKKIEKIVLARVLKLQGETDFCVSSILLELVESYPKCVIFAVKSGETCFLGASPETLIKLDSNQFKTVALAGSFPRDTSLAADKEIGKALLENDKNLEEHNLVIEDIVHILESLASKIEFDKTPKLRKLPNIQHLETKITGELKEGATIFDFIEKLHPTPAVGVYPRSGNSNIIQSIEEIKRGWYAAPVGWGNLEGTGHFIVSIRSGVFRANKALLYAGAGIINKSNPQEEWEETKLKFRPLLDALGDR